MKVKWKALGGLTIVLILGSWICNILYFQQMQLKEPLFLKHHIVVNSNHGEMIFINFLENKKAGKKVTGIQFADFPQIHFQIYQDQMYTHQVMMKAAAELKWNEDELRGKLPMTINEMLVYYNEGPPAKVPIGEIRVEKDTGVGLVDFLSSSGSSDGSGSYTVRTTRNATLEKIDYAFHDQIKPWFELKLSDSPIDTLKLPMQFRTGKELTFQYQWSIPDDELAACELFQSKIQLHFRTEDGRTVIVYVPINKSFNLTNVQVRHLVRTGGDLE